MGETVPMQKKINLNVLLPVVNAEIRFIHNGRKVNSIESNEGKFIVSKKGVYRVEVYYNSKAWIFSNHIRVGI